MIFDRLREIGDQSDRIASLEAEIARLRLTSAEREAVENAAYFLRQSDEAGLRCAVTLRGLLVRTKNGEK